MAALLSVADALALVLDKAVPLPAEPAPLLEADGRVLAADLAALRTQPPEDLSAMDGFAVRAADVANAPVTLRLIGEVAAGHPFPGTIGPGETARIFTGGVVPPGADAIVIQEHTSRDGDRVRVHPAGDLVAVAATVDEPEPDITDTKITDYACELGNSITIYTNEKDDAHIALRWKKRLHRLERVGTTTGALRFENKNYGLIWIGIPSKGILLDSKLNRQLANECKNAEQSKPLVTAGLDEKKS